VIAVPEHAFHGKLRSRFSGSPRAGNRARKRNVDGIENDLGENLMRRALTLAGALVAVSLASPLAVAEQSGAAAGAATGAITGAVVGGPIGAAVGGVAGAVIGDQASGPNRRNETVVVQPAPSSACETTTVRTENSYGDSKTVTRERC
jgi:phage tail tape-measure protein